MKLLVLGTSAAMPSVSRSHVSFVLWAGRPLLIECGPTIPWQLERAGVDHREIGDVFISHIHGDHSLGLPMFLIQGKLDGREWPVRVYCPASAVQKLKTICDSCYPSQADLLDHSVEWNGLPEDTPAQRDLGGGLRLLTAPGLHGIPEVAFRLEYEARSVVYSGDTAPAPGVLDLSRGADLLLHEATWSESIDGGTSPDHTSCRQAGGLAAEAGVGRLGLVHLHKRYFGREAQLLSEAAGSFTGQVFIPADGEQLEV
jgi:ribonuclease Z